VTQKTVLLIDDEQGFLEALADALEHEGHRVLKARTAEEALRILGEQKVHLATVDIMMPAGESLESEVSSHKAGIMLCKKIRKSYPRIDLFCLSVVSDPDSIKEVESIGVRFLRKGETPLRTVLNLIRSRLTGVAYSTESRGRERNEREPPQGRNLRGGL
jgi:DNA-binding NarL/FixJ family response regulator